MARAVSPPDPADLAAEWGRYGVSDSQLADLAAAGTPATVLGDMATAGPSDEIVYFGQTDDPISVEDFYRNQSDDWAYDADGVGYEYENRGVGPASTVSKAPAPITMAPTSTTNPDRPRTVAAGYDLPRRVLTCVFRDGTFYNYYDVAQSEWSGFKRYRSKGEYIRLFLDTKRRGVADVSSLSAMTQDLIYRVARTNQMIREGSSSRPSKVGGGKPHYDVRKRQQQFQKAITDKSGTTRYVTTTKPKWQGAPSAFYARYGTRYR